MSLNVDKNSIVTDMDMETWHSPDEAINEGVSFCGGSQYTYFLCDVSDGVVMIISYCLVQSWGGRCKDNELTLTYSVEDEAEPRVENYVLDYMVKPYIIGGHAYGDVQERYDSPCTDSSAHTWD